MDGEYYIQSSLGDKYIDVQWGSSKPETAIHLWEYTGTNAQKFNLIYAEPGYYYVQSKLGHYLYAPMTGGKITGSTLKVAHKKNADNFKWKFRKLSNGTYTIFSKIEDRVRTNQLDAELHNNVVIKGNKFDNGSPIVVEYNKSWNMKHKWRLKLIRKDVVRDVSNPSKPTTTIATDHSVIFRPANPNPNQLTTIKYGLWNTVFDLALKNVRIKINNYTPDDFKHTRDNTFRWVKPNDSSFELIDDKSPYRKVFNIKPFRKDPMTIYIHDLRLSRARTSHERGKVKISLFFEEDGIEIRTNCVDNFGCAGIGNPNFHFKNARIDVLFKPIVVNGKITYKEADVRLSGHLNHVGVNLGVAVIQGIADMLNFDVDSYISKEGEKKLKKYLNDPAVISAITTRMNRGINTASLGGHKYS